MPAPGLLVVTYHYVRELAGSRYPGINGLSIDAFRQQIVELRARCEMATLESALAFLAGEYRPTRHLCLLTFDDGFKDHVSSVMPILTEHGVEGVFFVITSCLEDRTVAAVHKSHFLMADLGFVEYRRRFLARSAEYQSASDASSPSTDAAHAYPFDSFEVAQFKFLFNFRMPVALRDRVVNELFADVFGDEQGFGADLYLSWDDARAMSRSGMIVGGHSHRHHALAVLDPNDVHADIADCARLLRCRLNGQALWPFSYPYGTPRAFDSKTAEIVRSNEFCCAFTTEAGTNDAHQDLFRLRRFDTNDAAVSGA